MVQIKKYFTRLIDGLDCIGKYIRDYVRQLHNPRDYVKKPIDYTALEQRIADLEEEIDKRDVSIRNKDGLIGHIKDSIRGLKRTVFKIRENYRQVLKDYLKSSRESLMIVGSIGQIIAVSPIFMRNFYFTEEILTKRYTGFLEDSEGYIRGVKDVFEGVEERRARLSIINGRGKKVKVDVVKYKPIMIHDFDLTAFGKSPKSNVYTGTLVRVEPVGLFGFLHRKTSDEVEVESKRRLTEIENGFEKLRKPPEKKKST